MTTRELYIRPHPFSQDTCQVFVRAGQTIAQMLDEAVGGNELADDVVVRIGGREVPRRLWAHVRPRAGVRVQAYRAAPLHGAGARRIAAAVIIIIAVIFQQYWATQLAAAFGGSAAIWGAGIMAAASFAASALTKPPTQGPALSTEGSWYQLTGTSNQINPWGPIPFVIGEHRFFPTHAALPYTEAVGEASYQTCMFDLGYGDLEVSDIRIGETALGDFDDVQYEITTTPTLYTADMSMTDVSASIDYDDQGEPVVRTTADGVTGISIDLVYGGGLFGVGTSGKSFQMWVSWAIEYRPAGSSENWMTPVDPKLSNLRHSAGVFATYAENKKPFAAGIRWDVPAGAYDVRVTRLASLRGDYKNTYTDSAVWTLMRASKPILPSTTGTNKLVLRIRASDQVNGTLQNLSCKVGQKIPVYDADADEWLPPAVSLSPAWIAWWLLTACPGVKKHVPTSRMHIDEFIEYADFCTANSMECRGVVDSAIVLGDLVNDVLACALGSLGQRDGKYTVVWDRNIDTPSMVFTPAETSDFKMQRGFLRIPDALRVQFVNPDAGWKQDEVIVLNDGFSHRGVDARGNASSDPEPEVFETLQLKYAADAIHAWRVGRYQMAQARFRRAAFSWGSDIAGISTARGDTVRVIEDVMEWSTGWGRVVKLEAGGLSAATITLDQPIQTDPAKSYTMHIRRADGTAASATLFAAGGDTNVFALTSMPSGVDAGDMATLVTTAQEDRLIIVTGAKGGADLSTEFVGAGYDARVAPFWANPPDSIISEITGMPTGIPPPPVVTSVATKRENSSPSDAGISSPVMHIGLRQTSGYLYDLIEDYESRKAA